MAEADGSLKKITAVFPLGKQSTEALFFAKDTMFPQLLALTRHNLNAQNEGAQKRKGACYKLWLVKDHFQDPSEIVTPLGQIKRFFFLRMNSFGALLHNTTGS